MIIWENRYVWLEDYRVFNLEDSELVNLTRKYSIQSSREKFWLYRTRKEFVIFTSFRSKLKVSHNVWRTVQIPLTRLSVIKVKQYCDRSGSYINSARAKDYFKVNYKSYRLLLQIQFYAINFLIKVIRNTDVIKINVINYIDWIVDALHCN